MDSPLDEKRLAFNGIMLKDLIYSGKFSSVKLGEKQERNGIRLVAIKVIDKVKVPPLFVEKFITRELKIWPGLQHRHILKFEKVLEIEHRIYIVMEYAPAGSIMDYLQKHGPANETLGRSWSKQMCLALKYLHEKSLAHRDVKCENLLLDRNLEVKLGDLDFICQAKGSIKDQFTLSYTFCGSLSYLAPEVLKGKPYKAIPADVWSAGVSIYVILNNTHPFKADDITSMRVNQMKKKWSFLPSVEETLSKSAKMIVARMLHPNPEERPTMNEIVACRWLRGK